MRPKFDKKTLDERKKEIIGYVKGSPLCSKDSIFTKARIPKSKVTLKLFDQLVSQKKILKEKYKDGKIRYYVKGTVPSQTEEFASMDTPEFLKKIADYMENEIEDSRQPEITRKLIEFFRIRGRVLELEQLKKGEMNLEGIRVILWHVSAYKKTPSKIRGLALMDMLSWAIKDDKHYLNHQMHSSPRQTKYLFQKKRRHLRRSLADKLEMKKKGRYGFGLRRSDYVKHMEKLPNIDGQIDMFFAERYRAFYNNPSKLKEELFKKASKQKFKPTTEESKRWKKFFDEYKRIYPKYPMKLYFECLSKKQIEEIKAVYKEDGLDYEEEKKRLIDYLDNVDPNTFLSSQPSS